MSILKKCLTPEFIVWMCTSLFGLGVAYQAIAGDINTLKEQQDKTEATVAVLRGEGIENRKDIEYIRDSVKEMKGLMRRQYARVD